MGNLPAGDPALRHIDVFAYVGGGGDTDARRRRVHLACLPPGGRRRWVLHGAGLRGCEPWLPRRGTAPLLRRAWRACAAACPPGRDAWAWTAPPLAPGHRGPHPLRLVVVRQPDGAPCGTLGPPAREEPRLWADLAAPTRRARASFAPWFDLEAGGGNNRSLRVGALALRRRGRGRAPRAVLEKVAPPEAAPFGQRAANLAALRAAPHPHVVAVLDFGRDWDGAWRVYHPWYPAGSLPPPTPNDAPYPLTLPERVRVLADAWAGVYHLHHALRIVHHDLKPENILLARRGGRLRGVVSGTPLGPRGRPVRGGCGRPPDGRTVPGRVAQFAQGRHAGVRRPLPAL